MASKMRALKVSSSPAESGLKIFASRLAAAAALRTSSVIGVKVSALSALQDLGHRGGEAGGQGAPPKSTGPRMTGCPGS